MIEQPLELVDVRDGPGEPVDALHAEAEEVDGLDTLVDDHGHRQAVPLVQPSQGLAKHGPIGRHPGWRRIPSCYRTRRQPVRRVLLERIGARGRALVR